MKITSIIIMTFFSLILVSACGDEVKAEIKLETIQCGMCVNTIEKNLKNRKISKKFREFYKFS